MMMNGQCGWMFGCFMVVIFHPKSDASSASSSTSSSTLSSTSTHGDQQQSRQRPSKHSKPEATTETGVTCYTCVNVSDNMICNRYAIDRPCPIGERFCHTLHIMDSRGASVIVNKKCADQSECSLQRVGCLNIDSQKVCVACCDEMYCNVSVPTNHTTAVFNDSRTRRIRFNTLESIAANAGQYHVYRESLIRFIPINILFSYLSAATR